MTTTDTTVTGSEDQELAEAAAEELRAAYEALGQARAFLCPDPRPDYQSDTQRRFDAETDRLQSAVAGLAEEFCGEEII